MASRSNPHNGLFWIVTEKSIKMISIVTGEDRFFCYGMVEGEILTVRFTMRKKNIRIVGAGYWRKGRKTYYENQE